MLSRCHLVIIMLTALSLLHAALLANGGGAGFVVGDALSYADVQLLHVLRAAESQFPEAFAVRCFQVLMLAHSCQLW